MPRREVIRSRRQKQQRSATREPGGFSKPNHNKKAGACSVTSELLCRSQGGKKKRATMNVIGGRKKLDSYPKAQLIRETFPTGQAPHVLGNQKSRRWRQIWWKKGMKSEMPGKKGGRRSLKRKCAIKKKHRNWGGKHWMVSWNQG